MGILGHAKLYINISGHIRKLCHGHAFPGEGQNYISIPSL